MGKTLPAATIKHLFDHTKASAKGRVCGTCSACCTVARVRLDGPDGPNTILKESGARCPNLRHLKPGKKGACSIYASRPDDCRAYTCYWLEGFGEKRDRPDRLGMTMDTSNGIIHGVYALAGVTCVSVSEVYPRSHKNPRFRAVLTGLVSRDIGVFYSGTGRDIPPIMAKPKLMSKIQAAMATLDTAALQADEHDEAGHPEKADLCPICQDVCPAHPTKPSPICGICVRVGGGG